MRHLIGIIFFVFLCSYAEANDFSSREQYKFRDITEKLPVQDFENIKSFILRNGDRQTYCNMFNDNPHYSFEIFETYLNPDIGQRNINCDTAISDFNELVIRDQNSDIRYYNITIVRKGDLSRERIHGILPGMQEERVYLVEYYNHDLDSMSENLDKYIGKIKNSIK